MTVWLAWALVARAETVDGQVARGWYLWQTGRDQEAAAIAAQAVAAEPEDLGAANLYAAMQVVAGEGFALESVYRERWADDVNDPVRRVALAMAVTYRHATKGSWCDDVVGLVAPVVDGEPHYWATVIDRQREARCTGQTGHADAELRRLARDPAGRGFADGVLAKLEAGYVKDDLPDQLAKVWADEPWRLDAAAVLWRDDVAGPGKPAAKRVAKDALDETVAGSDPVAVHAAVLAYAAAGLDKDRDAAAARLKALDPSADPTLVRTPDTVADPAVYGQIDACAGGYDNHAGLTCLDALAVPATGSVAAYAHYVRKLLYDGLSDPDHAYAEAKAAYEALPSHRFDARTFAKLAEQRSADLDLALTAITTVLEGRDLPADAPADQKAALARDLEIEVQILRHLGRSADAVPVVQRAQQLDPNPSRGLLEGMVLAEAGRTDEAAVMLAYALVTPIDDTARIREARDALTKAAAGWFPNAQAMIDAAAAGPKSPAASPLVGAKLVDPKLLPTPAEGAKTPGVRVVATWASWRPDSIEALSRLATLAAKYHDQGVSVVALGVDAEDTPPPALTGLEVRHAGPSALRALETVAVPTVVVVDAKGKVVAAFAPYDRGSLELETALDALL